MAVVIYSSHKQKNTQGWAKEIMSQKLWNKIRMIQ